MFLGNIKSLQQNCHYENVNSDKHISLKAKFTDASPYQVKINLNFLKDWSAQMPHSIISFPKSQLANGSEFLKKLFKTLRTQSRILSFFLTRMFTSNLNYGNFSSKHCVLLFFRDDQIYPHISKTEHFLENFSQVLFVQVLGNPFSKVSWKFLWQK